MGGVLRNRGARVLVAGVALVVTPTFMFSHLPEASADLGKSCQDWCKMARDPAGLQTGALITSLWVKTLGVMLDLRP